jgi:Na+/H+ antiporter NhaD/arsenite permease-like protein
MMVIIAILDETGVFYWVGIKANNLSKGNLWKLMLLLCTFTAIASMFIDNVTTILLMVPVTLSIVRILKVPPIPFILSQALVSNIGGTYPYRRLVRLRNRVIRVTQSDSNKHNPLKE